MFRRTTLSPSHYAGKWAIPEEEQRNDLKAVNQLGYEYATATDSPEKEARLLKILECFHGYLMKYVIMIVRGTIPPANSRAGRDAKELLRQLAPKGPVMDREQTDDTCKMLHLAFKQMTTEEIYDTLVFCFMKAARKYDPFYTDKVEEVCATINVLPKQFTEQHLLDRVGYDCTGILRALVRKGYPYPESCIPTRFYQHHGFDWHAIEIAAEDDMEGGRIRGGSTITQQLVKNLFFGTSRSFLRKGAEFTLVPVAELVLGKRRILELYLNVVEWGPAVYGAEAACRYYDDSPARKIGRQQAAELAAILPAPLNDGPSA